MVCVQQELYIFSSVLNIFLECYEIYIAAEVFFFGKLVLGIEAQITTLRLQSSLNEKLEMESFIFYLVFQQSQWVEFFFSFSLPLYQLYILISSLKINIENVGINQQIVLRFTYLMEVHQQHINSLHTNQWFTNYQRKKEMGGSLIINVLVYTHNGGSPVMSSIGFRTNICDSPNNSSGGLEVDYVWFYTHIGSPKKISRYGLHTNGI